MFVLPRSTPRRFTKVNFADHFSLHSSMRLFSTANSGENPYLYTSSVAELTQKIEQNIFSLPASTPLPKESVLQALQACRDVQKSVFDSDKLSSSAEENVQALVSRILGSENVNFDSALLKDIFLLKFPSQTAISVISQFYEKTPAAIIDKNTALIPLRHALYDGDLRSAIRVTDTTTGHKNYIAHKNEILRKGTLKLAASAIGITLFSKFGVNVAISQEYLSSTWQHLASLNAMILTYVLNSSFFVTVVRFGRQLSSAGGDFLTWQKGTFYTHWYRHADEMAMCTKIMEVDSKLNSGSNSKWLVEELCRKDERTDGGNLQAGWTRDGHKIRLLEPRDSIEDFKMQAYWMSGGDGFEWVEPDQDPAEIMWKQHLASRKSGDLGAGDARGLKWAEELIEEK